MSEQEHLNTVSRIIFDAPYYWEYDKQRHEDMQHLLDLLLALLMSGLPVEEIKRRILYPSPEQK